MRLLKPTRWLNLHYNESDSFQPGGYAVGLYLNPLLPAVITDLDPARPVYDKARTYVDAFFAYRTKIMSNKVSATFQLNIRNIQESGRLQAISAFPNGTANGYRIVDPRQFILTATFDL